MLRAGCTEVHGRTKVPGWESAENSYFSKHAPSVDGGCSLTWKWFRLLLSVYLGECRKMSRFCRRYQARAGSQGRQQGGRPSCSTSEGRLPGGWMNCREGRKGSQS